MTDSERDLLIKNLSSETGIPEAEIRKEIRQRRADGLSEDDAIIQIGEDLGFEISAEPEDEKPRPLRRLTRSEVTELVYLLSGRSGWSEDEIWDEIKVLRGHGYSETEAIHQVAKTLDLEIEETTPDENTVPDQKEDFDEKVARKCTIRTNSGLMVQSKGEQLIADFLDKHRIGYEYDKQITLSGNEPSREGRVKLWVRPDFYLNEFQIIIEYWGLKGTSDYDKRSDEKKRLYKEARMKYISVTPEDLSELADLLTLKLKRLGCIVD